MAAFPLPLSAAPAANPALFANPEAERPALDDPSGLAYFTPLSTAATPPLAVPTALEQLYGYYTPE